MRHAAPFAERLLTTAMPRICVADVVALLKQGLGDRQIIERYPSLNLAQVHAAISYYYENPEELEADLARMTTPRMSTNAGRPNT
jgi:hypothetical protein